VTAAESRRCFAAASLAQVYDPLDPDRSDLDTYLAIVEELGARRLLDGFEAHLKEACVGSISEIFDAEPPYTPRGCIAQAWSVAEVLRALRKTS